MGKPILHIVKIGGKLINEAELLDAFLRGFSSIPQPKILIHGGGRKATEISEKLGIETRMVHGRRITDAQTLEVAIMVYGGLLNRQLVAHLQKMSVNAIGLTGADGNLVRSHRREVKDIDYGFVGDIDGINLKTLESLLATEFVPVVCALSHDGNGQLLNTNADTMATQIAMAASVHYETTLTFCFEFPGVLSDPDKFSQTIGTITQGTFEEMRQNGTISAGMIPKISNGLEAAASGIPVDICGIENLISKKDATFIR
jgi:acetylglutamate kinase